MQAKRLFYIFSVMTIFPMGIAIITELNKEIVIWNFRIVDFLDLFLVAPFYFVVLVILLGQYSKHRGRAASNILLGFILFFLYGHSMHVTANSINTFATEVNSYVLPDDLYSLIYFLDEDLSHYIILISAYSILYLLFVSDGQSQEKKLVLNFGVLLFGGIYGIFQALVFLEGGKFFLGFVILCIFMLSWLFLWLKSKQKLFQFASTGFFITFLAAFVPALSLTWMVYALVFGGIPQPSQVF